MTVIYADTTAYLGDLVKSLGLGMLLALLTLPLRGVKNRWLQPLLWAVAGALSGALAVLFICGETFSRRSP